MEYVKQSDYDYIINKYHDITKPLESSSGRFMRHDAVFNEQNGMDGEVLLQGLREQDALLEKEFHCLRKAKGFEFVLKNTKISCDIRDRFPAINMVDRPLNRTLVGKWREEVVNGFAREAEEKRAYFERNGIVTIWLDYDHCVPDWDRILSLGFRGILEESESKRLSATNLTDEQIAFYDSIKITYNAVLDFIKRLELQAESQGSIRLAKALNSIGNNPPQTFYEALLVNYLFFIMCEHIEGLQVRSLSNFDRLYYKFYKRDIENGVSEEEIRSDLAYYLLQFTAIDDYYNIPIFLGGCNADETTLVNELSYLFLDTYDKMGIFNPKVQIKIANSTPKAFVLKAVDMIRRGNNSIVFIGDNTIRKALERNGVTREEARLCNMKGCYEYSVNGAIAIGMNYVNLLKPLEYALHKGCDAVNGAFAGRVSVAPNEYKTFEELFEEYKAQLGFLVEQVIETTNELEDYLDYINPQPLLSATYTACIEKARDALGGGAKYNTSDMAFGFIADAADSLTALKKYVFEKQEISLSEFVEILDDDFNSNLKFRKKLLADRDKYGNNKEIPDSLVVEINDFLCSVVCGKKNAKRRGGKWDMGYHVARMSYTQAPLTATSPNGRLRGEELSKNFSASMGMNREGATAAILSATKIDASKFVGDACLDLGLLPSAVKDDEGIEAMYGLVMTFIKRGGHAMHINVFDADTLREAQKYPEKYKDLQIRVCGWNVLFNNINKEEQDGFIRQAEGLI